MIYDITDLIVSVAWLVCAVLSVRGRGYPSARRVDALGFLLLAVAFAMCATKPHGQMTPMSGALAVAGIILMATTHGGPLRARG